MGALHIEMASFSMLGDWLKGSEWIQLLTLANVTTPDTAESFLSGSHVKRTRYAHQVTAVALYRLLKDAYNCKISDQDATPCFKEWQDSMRKQSAQFNYWNTVLELEMMLLTFVRSIREGDFEMYIYITCLENIAPWMFSLDHVPYSRWLPVFIQNLKDLHVKHYDVYKEFSKGKFTVQKSSRKFSSIR